jgi:hypothetical protein
MGGWHMAKQGAAPQPGNGGITALAYYSDHAGHVGSWVPSSRPAVLNGPYGEPSIVELSNGSVVLNLRLDFWQFSASMLPKAHCGISRSSGSAKPPKGYTWYSCRGIAISNDGGITFTDPWLDGRLVSPDDVASVVRGFALPKHTAAWGPLYYSSPLVQAKPRDNLTVLVSDTDGRSWRRPASFGGVVWSGDTKYSSMAPINSSHVAIMFERGGHNASSLASSPTMYSLISLGVIDVSVVMKQDDEISGPAVLGAAAVTQGNAARQAALVVEFEAAVARRRRRGRVHRLLAVRFGRRDIFERYVGWWGVGWAQSAF